MRPQRRFNVRCAILISMYELQENDYEHHVRTKVFQFMHEKLGVPEEDAYGIWKKAFVKYNQSLKALKESGFQFDVNEYWDFIRSGAEDFLKPDPQVSNAGISAECLCFVMSKLDLGGIRCHFYPLLGADNHMNGNMPVVLSTGARISAQSPTEEVALHKCRREKRSALPKAASTRGTTVFFIRHDCPPCNDMCHMTELLRHGT